MFQSYSKFVKYKRSTEILILENKSQYYWLGNYIDFNNLKFVKKIVLDDNIFEYKKTTNDILHSLSNILCDHSYNNVYFNYLSNLFDSPQIYMPSVLEIEIKYKIQFNILYLRSLPNLNKIKFSTYGNNLLKSLNFIKNIPKLRNLVFQNCSNIENFDLIKNYCDSEDIKLEIE